MLLIVDTGHVGRCPADDIDAVMPSPLRMFERGGPFDSQVADVDRRGAADFHHSTSPRIGRERARGLDDDARAGAQHCQAFVDRDLFRIRPRMDLDGVAGRLAALTAAWMVVKHLSLRQGRRQASPAGCGLPGPSTGG